MAFTDRHGGVSAAPFDSLNLGAASGDSEGDVERNFALLAEAFGVERVARMNQKHGAEVAVVRDVDPPTGRPHADAMVTDVPSLALAVRAADCVPVLLADSAAGVVGCAHAGRPGVFAGVLPATVAAMLELGARHLTAWVGPHVCGRCYEVPAHLQREVVAAVPAAEARTSWGTPALDIGAGARAQLAAAGCDLVDAARCTRESPELFSYRRDGKRSGRLAGLVRLLPEPVR